MGRRVLHDHPQTVDPGTPLCDAPRLVGSPPMHVPRHDVPHFRPEGSVSGVFLQGLKYFGTYHVNLDDACRALRGSHA